MGTSRQDEEDPWLEFEDSGEQETGDTWAWERGVHWGHGQSLWVLWVRNGQGLASSKPVVSL
jgi:hypothetical protein